MLCHMFLVIHMVHQQYDPWPFSKENIRVFCIAEAHECVFDNSFVTVEFQKAHIIS